MPQKITITISDEAMDQLKKHAEMEDMTLEKFIETAAMRYVEQNELINEFELARMLEEENLLE